jgi:hypothetical protein
MKTAAESRTDFPTPPGLVVLVGCCRDKGPVPTAARALYRSPRFRLAVEWAEASRCPWFILSGKHGLLAPDDVVAPYDLDLSAADVAVVSDWARQAVAALLDRVPGVRRVILLAGDAYAAPVAACLDRAGVGSELPLAGLTDGERLQRLAALPNDRNR